MTMGKKICLDKKRPFAVEICMGTRIAGIPRNPRKIRRSGYNCCMNTVGMEFDCHGKYVGCVSKMYNPTVSGKTVN